MRNDHRGLQEHHRKGRPPDGDAAGPPFLVALSSDLYCPRYNPGQALAKDSKLAVIALRYKINTKRLIEVSRGPCL